MGRQEDLARIATMEQGKPLAESRIEVMMNVGLFNFYAGECFRIYGRELVRPDGMRSTVRHEPVGRVAAFAPWNFPLRSEEHTSELQSLMRSSYAVFCWKKNTSPVQ